jgi:putative membrane protein
VNDTDISDDPRNHFAWLRTRMSAERTLESWIRTAIALIGFGFGIVQVFARLDIIANIHIVRAWLPRCIGLVMIGIGVFALAISVWQYSIFVRYLNKEQYKQIAGVEGMPRLPAFLYVAILLCLTGIFAIVAIIAGSK